MIIACQEKGLCINSNYVSRYRANKNCDDGMYDVFAYLLETNNQYLIKKFKTEKEVSEYCRDMLGIEEFYLIDEQ